jgi:putative DNA primase/helicase
MSVQIRKTFAVRQTDKPSGRSSSKKEVAKSAVIANANRNQKKIMMTNNAKARLSAKLVKANDDMFKFVPDGSAQGVYVQTPSGPRLLCPPLKPLGHTVNPDGSNPAMYLKLRTCLGDIRAIEIPKDEFKSPKALLSNLIKQGLDVDHELNDTRAKAIYMYLRSTVPSNTWLRVKRDGWFRLPDRSYGYVFGKDMYCGNKPYKASRPRTLFSDSHKNGELKSWLQLTDQLGDDPIAVMMMCGGFASPLLGPLERDATCIIITGDSGKGKSTILKLVSAIFSHPSNMMTWEATENGIEAATRKYQDKPFVIDEVGQGSGQLFAKAAYRLTNAFGKLRADSTGNLVENERNVSVVLSAGEQSPIALMMASGVKVKAGQRARLLCVPATEDYGVWSTINGFDSGAEKSKQIAAMLNHCHGVAGAQFCKYVARHVDNLEGDYASVARKLRKQVAKGVEFAADDGVVDRVLENFVLFAFAGMRAIDAGAVAWSKQQVIHAMQHGFALWYFEHQNSIPTTDGEIMNRLRLFFQSESRSKFKPFDQFNDALTGVVAGYLHSPRGDSEPLFLVYPAYFEKKVCDSLDKDAVIKLLRIRELLLSGPRGVPTKQFHVPGASNRSVSFYAIRQSILLD